MEIKKLDFEDKDQLGRVVTIDTSRVLISIGECEQMTSTAAGNLTAINGRTASELFTGIIERVIRSISEKLLLDGTSDDDSIPLGESQDDFTRAVLIGTHRKVDGSLSNTFKHGADCSP